MLCYENFIIDNESYMEFGERIKFDKHKLFLQFLFVVSLFASYNGTCTCQTHSNLFFKKVNCKLTSIILYLHMITSIFIYSDLNMHAFKSINTVLFM